MIEVFLPQSSKKVSLINIQERGVWFLNRSPIIYYIFFLFFIVFTFFCILEAFFNEINLLFLSISTFLAWGMFRFKKHLFQGVYIDAKGVGYKNNRADLFIPWKNLREDVLTRIDGDGNLYLPLVSSQLGVGVILNVYGYTFEDDPDLLPFEIEEESVKIKFLKKEESSLILKYIEDYRLYHNRLLDFSQKQSKYSQSGIRLEESNLAKRQVAIDIQGAVRFPSFCPFSGENCDSYLLIDNQEKMKAFYWHVSSKSIKKMKKYRPFLLFVLLFELGVSTYIAYYLFGQKEKRLLLGDILTWYFSIHLLFSCFLFFAWGFFPKGIVIKKINAEENWCLYELQNPYYFSAFLELNSKC